MSAVVRPAFEFGRCSVPDGKSGPWTVDRFDVGKSEALAYNIRRMRNPHLWIDAGRYARLWHEERGVVMSNTPMEVRSNREAYRTAHGRVLVNGLGLGMLLEGLLSKADVTYVRVVEVDPHVVRLVGPHFARDPRVEVILADALTYRPARGETFDYAWHDIWDAISLTNLPQMAVLGRRYNRRVATRQGFWGRDIIRADMRSC